MSHYITLTSVKKNYGTVAALDGITLHFPKSGMVFIKGKSGSGKTTLLNILGGLDQITAGSIIIDGQDISHFSPNDWDDYRNRIAGFVFQDYNLLEDITVRKNIELALDIQDELKTAEEKEKRIRETLNFVGLEEYESRSAAALSGGQKQRVAIARAVAKQSRIILADEPTGNLDTSSSQAVLTLLKKASRKRLVIIVTHDVASAFEYGDRIITISDGKVTEDLEIDNSASDSDHYSLKVTNEKNDTVFSAEHASRVSAKDMLSSWLIAQCGTHQFTFDIRRHDVSADTSKSQEKAPPADVRTRSLSVGQLLCFAGLNLAKKKVRLICTIILFLLSIFLLLSISFILTYNRTETISNYLSSHDMTAVYLYQCKQYEDSFYELKTNTISKGEKYYSTLHDLLPGAKLIPREKPDVLMLNKQNGITKPAYDITLISTDRISDLGYTLALGRMPKSCDEIAITDFVAKHLYSEKMLINQTIYCDNLVPMKVVGIIQTNCDEKQISLKMKRGELNEFEQFDLENVYQIAVTGDGYQKKKAELYNAIRLPRSNFLLSNLESKYLQSDLFYGSLKASQYKLSCGTEPQAGNEILISSQLAAQYDLTEADLGKEYHFINLYDTKYQDAYSDTLNLYDYFSDGIVVTGIFEPSLTESPEYTDILLDEMFYYAITTKYAKYYSNQDYILLTEDWNLKTLTQTIDQNGFQFREPAIEHIYQFQAILQQLFAIIVLIFCVILLLTVFLLSMFISNNIKVNTRKIGVLKAIGIETNQISIIFMIEAIIISIIAFLVASGLTAIFIWYINHRFVQHIPGHEFEYVYWNEIVVLLVAAFSIGLSICAAILPIMKLAKKKPVDIIRSKAI